MIMENPQLLRVTDVDYIGDYTLDLKFNNGQKRRVDFIPLLKSKKQAELKDKKLFIQYGLNHWTIEWANGVDFSPEYLYENGKAIN